MLSECSEHNARARVRAALASRPSLSIVHSRLRQSQPGPHGMRCRGAARAFDAGKLIFSQKLTENPSTICAQSAVRDDAYGYALMP